MRGLVTIVSAPLLFANIVWAAAVSETNGKVDAQSGNVNGSSANALSGTLTIPTVENWGLQLDIATGDVANNSFKAIGSHLFWRNPQEALVGLVLEHSEMDQQEFHTAGIETEWYFSSSTLTLGGGHLEGDGIDDDSYADIGYTHYLTNDWLISVAGSQLDNFDSLLLSSEYQLPDSNISLFVEIASGENNHDSFSVGARYYFGSQKLLKLRHREDDPPNRLFRHTALMTAYRKSQRKPLYLFALTPPIYNSPIHSGNFGNIDFDYGGAVISSGVVISGGSISSTPLTPPETAP